MEKTGSTIESWGYHLILDCARGNKEKIKDEENIIKFTKELVKAIDMVAYGEPIVLNFGSGNKAGFTLFQPIETSQISGHFCNETGDFYLDIFSCKPFEPDIVREMVSKYFVPYMIQSQFLLRDASNIGYEV